MTNTMDEQLFQEADRLAGLLQRTHPEALRLLGQLMALLQTGVVLRRDGGELPEGQGADFRPPRFNELLHALSRDAATAESLADVTPGSVQARWVALALVSRVATPEMFEGQPDPEAFASTRAYAEALLRQTRSVEAEREADRRAGDSRPYTLITLDPYSGAHEVHHVRGPSAEAVMARHAAEGQAGLVLEGHVAPQAAQAMNAYPADTPAPGGYRR